MIYNRYLRYLLEALVKRGYVDFVCNKMCIRDSTYGGITWTDFEEDYEDSSEDE